MIIHPTIWLAMSVYFEARGEPFDGKLAVAYVHRNRVESGKFPGSIEDVIWQPYQFSWTHTGDPNRMKLDDLDWNDPVFDTCFKAAVAAHYKLLPDPTNGATHYMNVDVVRRQRGGTLPKWVKALEVTAKIENHTFFK